MYLTKNSYLSLNAWFRSYLSGRRHRVVIDNESSDFLPVTSESRKGQFTVLAFYQ